MNIKNTKSFMQFYNELGLNEVFSKKTSGKLKINTNFEKGKILSTSKNKEKLLKNLEAEILNLDIGLKDTATNLVFGSGNVNADVMVLGDAPDSEDDREGQPFQGEIGNLLEKILGSIGLTNKNTYLSNLVFWRPPGNRIANQDEVNLCLPYTEKHIKIINPKYLILLGGITSKSILKTEKNITQLRGSYYASKFFEKVQIFPIFHPKFLIQNSLEKKKTWFDLLYISKIINNKGNE